MLKNRTSTVMYETMTSVHQSPAFADLRELVLCGFSLDDTDDLGYHSKLVKMSKDELLICVKQLASSRTSKTSPSFLVTSFEKDS
ncbi:hypothetical protein MRB53_040592 [Persea americana]|nr:hypothetical protein MRB53_040592 [Persea americana]